MAIHKYISTKDAVRLTGLSTQEIYALIHDGLVSIAESYKDIPYIIQGM